jgi:hypothetical protein
LKFLVIAVKKLTKIVQQMLLKTSAMFAKPYALLNLQRVKLLVGFAIPTTA